MKTLNASKNIYINTSSIKNGGRGVFAAKNIKKDDLIEKCPTIEISEKDPSNTKEGVLITYLFYFGKKKKGQAIALGFGSIYNHSRNPNALYKINQKDQVIDFFSIKDINKDEEITINYNYANPNDKMPLWFE